MVLQKRVRQSLWLKNRKFKCDWFIAGNSSNRKRTSAYEEASSRKNGTHRPMSSSGSNFERARVRTLKMTFIIGKRTANTGAVDSKELFLFDGE